MKVKASTIPESSRADCPASRIALGAALCCVLFIQPLLAQDAPRPSSQEVPGGSSPPPSATPAVEPKKPSETAPQPPAVMNDPRQARIVADTQKLLKLSQELKAEVAKSNKDTLSLSVVRKAEEVEKLAKALKEEMSKQH